MIPVGTPLKSIPVGGLSNAGFLFAGLLRALSFVSQLGIVHLDISPRNLILKDRRLILIDWGCAGVAGELTSYEGAMVCASDSVLKAFGEEPFGSTKVSFTVNPSDDISSVLKVACAMMVPGALSILNELRSRLGSGNAFPKDVLLTWERVWKLPGAENFMFDNLDDESHERVAHKLVKLSLEVVERDLDEDLTTQMAELEPFSRS